MIRTQNIYPITANEMESIRWSGKDTGLYSAGMAVAGAASSAAVSAGLVGKSALCAALAVFAVFAGIVALAAWPSKKECDRLIQNIKDRSVHPDEPEENTVDDQEAGNIELEG